jgi:antitoxin HicB
MRSQYSYPARIERDEEGRYQVRFADLSDALTDGADPAEALTEAADCLSAAIASRIIDGEEIPKPSPPAPGQRLVSPDPTIALKAALYAALRRRDMTVADLADVLGMGDWHQAARLIDPKRSTKLTTLMAALDALRCEVEIAVNDAFAPDDGAQGLSQGSQGLRQEAVPPASGGAVMRGLDQLLAARRSPAAPRGTRPAQPLLVPVARPQSPPKAGPSPAPGKPRGRTYAQAGRALRQGAEPGAPSRRKSKARSSE